MITKNNAIVCDDCGKFVSYKDLADGTALHALLTPDSDLTKETWESLCRKCFTKELVDERK